MKLSSLAWLVALLAVAGSAAGQYGPPDNRSDENRTTSGTGAGDDNGPLLIPLLVVVALVAIVIVAMIALSPRSP
jgi:hypothetical protein